MAISGFFKKRMESIKSSFVVTRDNLEKRSYSLVFLWFFVFSILFLITNFIIEIYMMNEFSHYYEKAQIKAEESRIKANLKLIKDTSKQDKAIVEAQIRDSLKKRIDIGYSVIKNIHNKFLLDGKSEIEVEEAYVAALGGVSFDKGRNYYTVFTIRGKNILNPNKTRKELEGKNLIKTKDSKGVYIIQKMVNMARNEKEGMLYWHYKLKDGMTDKRVVYVKFIEPLNIFISTSVFYSYYLTQKIKVLNDKNIRYLLPNMGTATNYFRSLNLENSNESRKKKKNFLKNLRVKKSAFMNFRSVKKLTPKELEKEYGMLKYALEYIPKSLFNTDIKRQYILYAKLDMDINRYIFVKNPVEKLQDQAKSLQGYYMKLIASKLLYLLLAYLVIARIVTGIMKKKISLEIKKILKELGGAKSVAEYNQRKLNDFIEHYPYPMVIVDDKAKKFTVNKAFKSGGEFQGQYYQHNDAHYNNSGSGMPYINQNFINKKIESGDNIGASDEKKEEKK